MRKAPILLSALGLILSTPMFAVTVDQFTFRKYGGDPANVGAAIRDEHVLDILRMHSFARPWQSVGKISIGDTRSSCTATWIGEEANWSYVLTAAHCIKYAGSETPVSLTFTGWDETVVAEGAGTAYVHANRVNVKSGQGIFTDIAIVRLPRRKTPVDDTGVPLEQPIFNDSNLEPGRTVIFTGYGQWGVGTDVNDYYAPALGIRRLYGRNLIDRTYPRLLTASFDPHGPSPHWAGIGRGDSGSAWWQFQQGKPVMVAISAGSNWAMHVGTRVSDYIDWIKTTYPGARLLSQEKPRGCIVLAGALSIGSRRTYCLHAGESSGYSLPTWVYGRKVDIQADSGVRVVLSDFDNLSYNRLASFSGTVENADLKRVKSYNGEYLDFSRPRSMRVENITDEPLGCIVSLVNAEKYCLPAGSSAIHRLPAWIRKHDVFVRADPGLSVVLYDNKNRGKAFNGEVQNHELQTIPWMGEKTIDLSQPISMTVIKQS